MSVIYVMCPANLHSGGPELLHQLCYKLRLYGYDARMSYYPVTNGSKVHPNYVIYQNPVEEEIIDSDENFVIVPETVPQFLETFSNATSVLWWLSVDYYHCGEDGMPDPSHEWLREHPRILHFVQSEYARLFVLETVRVSKEKVFYLADYLRDDFFTDPFITLSASERLPFLLYNPKKGLVFTQRLLDIMVLLPLFSSVKCIPLIDFTPGQLALLMRKSMLYIDFGEHPGMDRLPREAAANGCCIIVGKQGAAQYSEDVPIPDEYKFETEDAAITNILTKIHNIMNNYDTHIENFSGYRFFIRCQENKFEKDVSAIFTQLIAPPTKRPFAGEGIAETYDTVVALYNAVGEGLEYSVTQYSSGAGDKHINIVNMSG